MLEFRYFEDSEISRFLKFRDFDDFEIPRFLRYYSAVMNGRERCARRASECLDHVSACPNMPTMPDDRAVSILGKSKIFDFENFGTGSEIWARPCPSLALAAFRARA